MFFYFTYGIVSFIACMIGIKTQILLIFNSTKLTILSQVAKLNPMHIFTPYDGLGKHWCCRYPKEDCALVPRHGLRFACGKAVQQQNISLLCHASSYQGSSISQEQHITLIGSREYSIDCHGLPAYEDIFISKSEERQPFKTCHQGNLSQLFHQINLSWHVWRNNTFYEVGKSMN